MAPRRKRKSDEIEAPSQKFFRPLHGGKQRARFAGDEGQQRAIKAYSSEVKKTIAAADVIIEV